MGLGYMILATAALSVYHTNAQLGYFEAANNNDRGSGQKRYIMGTYLDEGHFSRDHGFISEKADSSHIPAQFHASQKWPHCASTIGYIKDQGVCGSCWAVAGSSMMADRTCIKCDGLCRRTRRDGSDYDVVVGLDQTRPCIIFSAEQLMSCCKYCGHGLLRRRLSDRCNALLGKERDCNRRMVRIQMWMSTIQSRSNNHYKLAADADVIKTEIMQNGPVECAFKVYSNFQEYPRKSIYNHKDVINDVYVATVGEFVGGHAIKIVGWDEDSEAGQYWIIHNSWNTTWGLKGIFKYKLGVDLGGMESNCVAGIPSCKNSIDNKLHCL